MCVSFAVQLSKYFITIDNALAQSFNSAEKEERMNSCTILRRFMCCGSPVSAAPSLSKKKPLVFLGSPDVSPLPSYSLLLYPISIASHSSSYLNFRFLQLFWNLFSMHLRLLLPSLRYTTPIAIFFYLFLPVLLISCFLGCCHCHSTTFTKR